MVLLRVALSFLLLLLLPDLYIYRLYVAACRSRLKYLYWLPSLVLLLGLGGFLLAAESGHTVFGTYLVALLCITVPKVLFVVSDVLLRLCGLRSARSLRVRSVTALSVAGLGLGYLLYGALWGKEDFRVRQVTFTSPDLPAAFDGYRLLQLSDIHIGSWGDDDAAIRRAVRLCNDQRPDAIVFTGDLVNSRATELAPFLTALSQLQAPDGVYSVLGNHDYGTYARWSSPREQAANLDTLKRLERQLGWRLLLNEHHCLHRGSDSIVVAGVENSGRPPFPDRGDLRRALQGTNGRFRILLSHDPTHWRREVLPRTDVQLTLSGHTHDMQVSLFGFSVSRWIYPEHRGLYLEGGRALYVNIGLGYVLFPLRLGAWPEITVITLRTTPMNLSQKNQPK